MGSRQVGLLLTVGVMLVATFGCGNCNMQVMGKVMSVRSNAVTRLEESDSVVLHRDSRSVLRDSRSVHRDSRSVHRSRRTVLNSMEMQQALDTHNWGRRQVGSADMEFMIWNDYLASMADDWSKNCQWQHGQPSRDPNTLPYRDLGQNLYAVSGVSFINITAAIMDWFNERPFFDYDTLGCKSGEQCGHYTQIVWATSRELGCAYSNCPTLAKSNFTASALFLVCNYGPAGNIGGQKPFKMGPGCSKCASGSWWCNSGLCDQSCRTVGSTCGCAPLCLNFGAVNSTTCSCSCPPGWQGSDCSVECKDFDPLCNPAPGQSGYPPDYCSRADTGPQTRQKCPKMCNLCQPIGTSATTTPATRPSSAPGTISETEGTSPTTAPATRPSTASRTITGSMLAVSLSLLLLLYSYISS